jgi:hypothetical protein
LPGRSRKTAELHEAMQQALQERLERRRAIKAFCGLFILPAGRFLEEF